VARGLRVVAGSARGVPLVVPDRARPTTGRVREAVFSTLGDVAGAAVLDLFAGSGAFACEALSRGATRALLVDSDPGAADACRRNLEATDLADRGRVERGLVSALLDRAPPSEAPFDLVSLDPPYETSADALAGAVGALGESGWLRPGARVVVERASRRGAVTVPERWEVAWERRYGDTLVTILRRPE
jgi:16S rRNA (guanine966-N2)-methyltransferase